ncbi:MAG: hypothetical protein JWQ90_4811 [Hydrocarboniphaga sp.]|nr:DUF4399 domain-containing protein [Hydrocarboniphaga sp.]MDB5972361.1 hypothetical protein [Hydrocarboniphaga sp.]
MMKSRTLALSLLVFASLPAIAADKVDYKSMAKQQAGNYAAEKLNLPTAAPAGAKVYFPTLKDGDTVSSPVTVVFGLAAMGIAPAGTQVEGTGHHHLLIDGPTIDYTMPLPMTDQIKHFGKGQTETTLTLTPGKHTLQLVFGDWKHQPFNPSIQSDKITITVK